MVTGYVVIPNCTLQGRLRGAQPTQVEHQKQQLLTTSEGKAIVQSCIKLDNLGRPSKLSFVKCITTTITEMRSWKALDFPISLNAIPALLQSSASVLEDFFWRIWKFQYHLPVNARNWIAKSWYNLGSLFERWKSVPKTSTIWMIDEQRWLWGGAGEPYAIPRMVNGRWSRWSNVSRQTTVSSPMFIYKGTNYLYADVKKDLDAGKATFAWSTKGWTDNELGL